MFLCVCVQMFTVIGFFFFFSRECGQKDFWRLFVSIQKADGHFLLHIRSFQSGAELLEWNHLVTILIGLDNSPFRDANQLFLTGQQ